MTESEGKSEKMASEQKRDRTNLLALTGTAALLALAVNLAVSAFNSHKKRTKKKGSLSFPHSPIYFRKSIHYYSVISSSSFFLCDIYCLSLYLYVSICVCFQILRALVFVLISRRRRFADQLTESLRTLKWFMIELLLFPLTRY